VAGRHRAEVGDRHELYANTIASWTWSQGTLAVSIVTVPTLTRLLNQPEYGLWTQLLSLSALATVADMGMSLVFLRRATDNASVDSASMLQSATAFYRTITTLLTITLVLVCTLPHGLLSPYMNYTSMPIPAALAVIAGISVNLRCQTSTLRLLARGRMDVVQIFGAGPAIVGTFATVLTAYFYRTAAAMSFAYAAVEIFFDIALMITARHYASTRGRVSSTNRSFVWWVRVWYESTGVAMIDVVPMISLLIGVTVVSHVVGLAAAAIYGVAGKVGSLVRRFITPFTESLFVSLCRATFGTRSAMTALLARLSVVALSIGITAAFVVVTAGPIGMRVAFGSTYESAVWVVLIMVLSDTVRCVYRPFLRKIQSENDIGSLRFWFLTSIIVQVPLAVFASVQWSTIGAAIAVLACTFLFEAIPAAWKVCAGRRLLGVAGRPILGQALAVLGAACLALLLAWGRRQMGAFAVSFAAAGAITTGLFALAQVLRYLAAARSVRGPAQIPDPNEDS